MSTPGLLKLAMKLSWRSVIGHEIGHIASRHTVRANAEAIAGGVATVAGLDRNTAVQIGVIWR